MKRKMRKKINWGAMLWLVRNFISKFGYISCGAFLAVMIEHSRTSYELVAGAILGLLLGICANIDNEKNT